MATHIAIHDVSPAWEPEIDAALKLCARFGAKPALLVVPDYHARWPLREHASFTARLRALAEAGHEVLLHGYFHQARTEPLASTGEDGRPRGFQRFFAQRVVSAGEAEFSDLSRSEANERLDQGLTALGAAGLTPSGFVPPAWSMPAWVHELLRNRGFRYTEDHLFVYDPTTYHRRPSVVLNFASRTPARMWSSVAFCRVGRMARRLAPTRIALHPGDFRVPRLVREAESLLRWGADDFVSTTAAFMGRTGRP
ncbi:MAG: polysaccharide deacetylase family protein [Polyangiaceae bacterium]|nr:polysaccharide deacetylase family protein [Polyangiaceae bacterium]